MCDSHDLGLSIDGLAVEGASRIGGSSRGGATEAELSAAPTIFIYDNYPGGIGFSEPLLRDAPAAHRTDARSDRRMPVRVRLSLVRGSGRRDRAAAPKRSRRGCWPARVAPPGPPRESGHARSDFAPSRHRPAGPRRRSRAADTRADVRAGHGRLVDGRRRRGRGAGRRACRRRPGRVRRHRSRLGAASQPRTPGASRSMRWRPMRRWRCSIARVGRRAGWADRVVFFDLETTGLSGGAGTLPFLAGCGWFEDDAFRVRQFFLAGPAGERAMLGAIGENLRRGQPARDVQRPNVRRAADGNALGVPPHGGRDRRATATSTCCRRRAGCGGGAEPAAASTAEAGIRAARLHRSLERSVLGLPSHRRRARLRNPGALFSLPSHRRCGARLPACSSTTGHDLLSTAAVMSHALWMAREGPEACRESSEMMGLGRLYEQAGDVDRARRSVRTGGGGRRPRRAAARARAAGRAAWASGAA